jgi:Rad51 protein
LGKQDHSNQLLKYYCSKCDTLLKETNIDICLSNSKEECPHCGSSLVSETLRKENEHKTSSLALPKIQTAYEEFSISRLTFDIRKIDSLVDLTAGDTACIMAANKKHANTLLTRLCVRALMSNRQGGFNSSKVIFVDAGNTSDVYQCVNFARQYGLDIKQVLQSIVVSRSFTIYQLSNTIINELPNIIEQFSGAKAVIIGELLSMFANDPQVQIKEAESLIRQIINAVRKLCIYNNILCVISFCSNNKNITKTYARLILQRIDKCIEIDRGEGNDKKNKKNNDLSINIKIKKNHPKQQHYSILLQEKILHLVSER